jgi:hypothetical protein
MDAIGREAQVLLDLGRHRGARREHGVGLSCLPGGELGRPARLGMHELGQAREGEIVHGDDPTRPACRGRGEVGRVEDIGPGEQEVRRRPLAGQPQPLQHAGRQDPARPVAPVHVERATPVTDGEGVKAWGDVGPVAQRPVQVRHVLSDAGPVPQERGAVEQNIHGAPRIEAGRRPLFRWCSSPSPGVPGSSIDRRGHGVGYDSLTLGRRQ